MNLNGLGLTFDANQILSLSQTAATGATAVKQAPSTGKKVASGAAAGAAAGSIVPGVGTAIGAAVGAVAGLVSGLIKGSGNAEGWTSREVAAGIYALMALGYTQNQILQDPGLNWVVVEIGHHPSSIEGVQKTAPELVQRRFKDLTSKGIAIPAPLGNPIKYKKLSNQESLDLIASFNWQVNGSGVFPLPIPPKVETPETEIEAKAAGFSWVAGLLILALVGGAIVYSNSNKTSK